MNEKEKVSGGIKYKNKARAYKKPASTQKCIFLFINKIVGNLSYNGYGYKEYIENITKDWIIDNALGLKSREYLIIN